IAAVGGVHAANLGGDVVRAGTAGSSDQRAPSADALRQYPESVEDRCRDRDRPLGRVEGHVAARAAAARGPPPGADADHGHWWTPEENTSELPSLMRNSY